MTFPSFMPSSTWLLGIRKIGILGNLKLISVPVVIPVTNDAPNCVCIAMILFARSAYLFNEQTVITENVLERSWTTSKKDVF